MSPPRYATGTTVSVTKTRMELEKLLVQYGAAEFAGGWNADESRVMFKLADRLIRLSVLMPDPGDRKFSHTPAGRRRTPADTRAAFAAEERRRWRALLIVTKARLVAVAEEVQTVEQAFLADIVLPDGSTVGEWAAEQLPAVYARNAMPPVLPGARPALPPGDTP